MLFPTPQIANRSERFKQTTVSSCLSDEKKKSAQNGYRKNNAEAGIIARTINKPTPLYSLSLQTFKFWES